MLQYSIFVFADNYRILNDIVQNMKADIPRVKIKALKKELHKFTSLKKIEKSNYSIQQTSVSTDESERQLDSSACITNFNVSVTSKSKYAIKI